MCGGEPSLRIEKADNGYIVEAYKPGDGEKPGKHFRMVASSPEQALAHAKPHLSKMNAKKQRGMHMLTSAPQAPSGYGKAPKKGKAKRGAKKR